MAPRLQGLELSGPEAKAAESIALKFQQQGTTDKTNGDQNPENGGRSENF
jgi:hypothetical protein